MHANNLSEAGVDERGTVSTGIVPTDRQETVPFANVHPTPASLRCFGIVMTWTCRLLLVK